MQIKMATDHLILGKQIAWKIFFFFNIQYTLRVIIIRSSIGIIDSYIIIIKGAVVDAGVYPRNLIFGNLPRPW